LFDKDIRNLQPREQRYFKFVGNPRELVIFISHKDIQRFSLKVRDDNGEVKFIGLKEFRAEARQKSTKILGELETGKDIAIIKGNDGKYIFKNLFNLYIEQKQRQGLNKDYINKIVLITNKYLMPSLAHKDIKTIKRSNLLAILTPYLIQTTHRQAD